MVAGPVPAFKPWAAITPVAWCLGLLLAASLPRAIAQTTAIKSTGSVDWTQSLAAQDGNAARGAAIVASRQSGLCLLCHPAPVGDSKHQGDIAPDLAGAGRRWTAAQLRERIADGRLINPESIMPRYFQTEGLHRVAPQAIGKPLLSGQEIEDVIAFLLTLKN